MLLLPSVSSVAHLWGVQRGLTCAVKVIGESREAQIELSFLLLHGVRKARPTRSGANLCKIAPHLFPSDYRRPLNMFRSLIVRGLPSHAWTGSRRPVYRGVTRSQNLVGQPVPGAVIEALIRRR
jgi:hypothetical protein